MVPPQVCVVVKGAFRLIERQEAPSMALGRNQSRGSACLPLPAQHAPAAQRRQGWGAQCGGGRWGGCVCGVCVCVCVGAVWV